MPLQEYRKKRSFEATPEPTGGKAPGNKLIFVVQKHAASRLHYDFRLEMNGVLKSWAVPKGPSLNPADKRLAMLVEDHPFDYRGFEGIIPKGNYGAGTVIVWDEGTYEPLESTGDKAKDGKALLRAINAGSLKIRLDGKKLKGEFALVRLKGKQENAWLLIKHKDKFAIEADITQKDKSVKSGKTLEQIAKGMAAREAPSSRKAASIKKSAASKKSTALTNTTALKKGLNVKKTLPARKVGQLEKPAAKKKSL